MTIAASFAKDPFVWLWDAGENVVDFFTDHPIRRLQSAAQDTVTFVEHWLSSFSIGDWVLVGLAGVAVYWVVASLKALTSLGPIEVESLEHDADPTAAVKALTSELRERLAHTGLSPPPTVPAGTPQVDLIAAVEASNIPQSAWLAKVLQLLPKPPRPAEYKINGVLTGVEPTPPAPAPVWLLAAADPTPCGVRYWIKASREGSTLLKTVEACPTHSAAIEQAASEIYLHISKNAIHAFPLWARWHTRAALEDYLEGCRLRDNDDGAAAAARFQAAVVQERDNALAKLQLANMEEEAAPKSPRLQAQALRRYLTVAAEWPELVEARYRASVVASRLAGILANGSGGVAAVNLGAAPGAGAPQITVDQLRSLASRETAAVLQLLRPWYVLVREKRLRNQFELKSQERRTLRHTVSITKHGLRLRRLSGTTSVGAWAEIRYRTYRVGAIRRKRGWGAAAWQTHYNASCYDALLLAHLRSI
jgi:hypothetical protein